MGWGGSKRIVRIAGKSFLSSPESLGGLAAVCGGASLLAGEKKIKRTRTTSAQAPPPIIRISFSGIFRFAADGSATFFASAADCRALSFPNALAVAFCAAACDFGTPGFPADAAAAFFTAADFGPFPRFFDKFRNPVWTAVPESGL
jgi:hypothetical protein